MVTRKYGKGYWKTFREGIEREWVIVNGIGGYAGCSIIGANTRKHHGLLVASLHPPVERYLLLSRINELLVVGEKEYSLAAVQRKGAVLEEGQHYLQRFIYDAVPHYIYQAEDVFITKSIAMKHGENKTAICYEIENGGRQAYITLTPLFNYRDHGGFSTVKGLKFRAERYERKEGVQIVLCPIGAAGKDYEIVFEVSEGNVFTRKKLFDEEMELQTEIDTGMSAIDNNYTPYDIQIKLAPYEKKKISVVCYLRDTEKRNMSVEKNVFAENAFYIIEEEIRRMKELIEKTGYQDELAQTLIQAADAFIVDRISTGNKTILAGLPWFTDWGRDTMIAMQGLTLCTGRYEDAKGILRTFAKYVRKGLVPNMFPDEGLEPLYNTVDASLWYFYSVYKYLEYTGSDDEYAFVEEEIYPKLKEIIQAYQYGTDFHIYMDDDGLIHAGGELDQVTWMDVRAGDWVATPRHGKPVEINALWYNALKVMEQLAVRYGDGRMFYRELAKKVKLSFNEKFWNGEKACLYDVAEEEKDGVVKNNDQIRPNQIWAVSLPFTMLSEDKEKKIVETVWQQLYASYGLRSLSPEDAEYKGIYFGKLHDRDAAYHQGTVWAFPLGGFLTAYVKVYGKNGESRDFAKKLLEPIEDHLADGCIGSVAEIFDGDEPHVSRGCYAQAWSVGEILRAYAEDILNE